MVSLVFSIALSFYMLQQLLIIRDWIRMDDYFVTDLLIS